MFRASARAKFILEFFLRKNKLRGTHKDFYRQKLCPVYQKKGKMKNTTFVLAIADPASLSEPRR